MQGSLSAKLWNGVRGGGPREETLGLLDWPERQRPRKKDSFADADTPHVAVTQLKVKSRSKPNVYHV